MSMDDATYLKTQETLVRAASEIATLDLTTFLQRIETAEGATPVLDPSLFRRGADSLAAVKDLAIAAKRIQHAHRNLQRAVVDRLAKDAERGANEGDGNPNTGV